MGVVHFPSDEVAIARFLRETAGGDMDAFANLYDATCHRVYSVVLRVVTDASVAEEVTLDVYQALWRGGAADYSALHGRPLPWLLGRAVRFARGRQMPFSGEVAAFPGRSESATAAGACERVYLDGQSLAGLASELSLTTSQAAAHLSKGLDEIAAMRAGLASPQGAAVSGSTGRSAS